MSKVDIVYVPVSHPVGDLGEPALDQRTVLGLLESDHEGGVVEVRQ